MTLSKWTRIQGGNGPGVLVYLSGPGIDADHNGIGDLDEAMMAALPGIPIARTGVSGYAAEMGDLDAGLRVCGSNMLGALVGYSGGCQGVRAHLWRGVDPKCVALFDGTAGPWPLKDDAREVTVWRDRAAQRDRVSIFTATSQRYVEQLKKTATQPVAAYASTSRVLSRALGWPEAEQLAPLTTLQGKAFKYPGLPALELHREGTHAFVYRGTDCDHDAHVAQMLQVMPEMLARYVAPALGIQVDVSALELLAGPLEAMGRAIGVRLAEAWQAAVDGAGGVMGTPSHGARCAVHELVSDARNNGKFHKRGSGYRPKPGDLIISARNGQEPENGGEGHVERAAFWKDGVLWTIGGNENNTWVEAPYDIDGASFRGVIEVDAEIGRRALLIARAEKDAGVKELPGAAHHKQIQAYHACTRRGGSTLAGMPGHELEGSRVLGEKAADEISWCASSASWCTVQALAA